MKTKRINLISGPRNISTALMYSFANRSDAEVVDEPMYGYYLAHTKIGYHPGTKEILDSLPNDIETVKEQLIFQPLDVPVYFIKGMAHHYVDVDLSFLTELENIFLIRNPYQLIASFAQVISHPSLEDIGLRREWEICQYLLDRGKTPIVLDSVDILTDPPKQLEMLCQMLEIEFSKEMLSWSEGPIRQDGVWAKYWYENVWRSTGFVKQKTSTRKLPNELQELYTESLQYYDLLRSLQP